MKDALRLMTSSQSEHWCTPPEVLAPVRAFSPIRFDPFSNGLSLVGAAESVAPPSDSLLIDWPTDGPSWCNPPYGRALARCAAKIAEQSRRGVEVLTLVPARTDTKWWRALAPVCWCAWEGRIFFLEEEAAWRARVAAQKGLSSDQVALLQPRRRLGLLVQSEAAPFAAALCYHGQRPAAFAAHFAPYGQVYFTPGQKVARPVGRPRAHVPPVARLLDGLQRGLSLRKLAQELKVPKNRIEVQARLLRAELRVAHQLQLFRTGGA